MFAILSQPLERMIASFTRVSPDGQRPTCQACLTRKRHNPPFRASTGRMIPISIVATVLFGTAVVAQDVSITIGRVEDQCENQCTMSATWFQHALDLTMDEAQFMWEGCLEAC